MSVVVVGGPAGTGKTTIAELVSARLHAPFVEGDVLHPAANVAKMAAGTPLTDEDRWGWLQTLSKEGAKAAGSGVSVVSCSMLKKSYRDLIQSTSPATQFTFVFLYGTFDELVQRFSGRQGHFMKSEMVKSQLDIMQIPEGAELLANGGRAVAIDTTGRSPQEIVALLEPVCKSLES
ncbi:hypothetical protein DICA3_F13300 [Diutina catenulata]